MELLNQMSELDLGNLRPAFEDLLLRVVHAESKSSGELDTPDSVARLLVEMIEPYHGRVYDPCCGSGRLLVQSVRALEALGGQRGESQLFGQEVNAMAWRLAQMNLELHGITADLGNQPANVFLKDLHPDLQADFILANPPFNDSEWGGEQLEEDARWRFGTPPKGNANFAWVQHFVHHLSPGGIAGFVLPNGSMSSMQSGEGEIRRRLVEADLVECMVACPGQLFHSTQIPVCLWFLSRRKEGEGERHRRHQVLFLDARAMGRMETRVHRVLDPEDIARLTSTYRSWRDLNGEYEDVPGFAKSSTLKEIALQDFVLTPGRYVGSPENTEKGVPHEATMERLIEEFQEEMAEAARLDQAILQVLKQLSGRLK